jgi:hypothetical protein
MASNSHGGIEILAVGTVIAGVFIWIEIQQVKRPIMGSPLHALFPETRRALLVSLFPRCGQRRDLRALVGLVQQPPALC